MYSSSPGASGHDWMLTAAKAAAGWPLVVHEKRQKFLYRPVVSGSNARRFVRDFRAHGNPPSEGCAAVPRGGGLAPSVTVQPP